LHTGTNASCTATRNPALSACTTSGGITCTRTTSGFIPLINHRSRHNDLDTPVGVTRLNIW
jgi:hypothetical protein